MATFDKGLDDWLTKYAVSATCISQLLNDNAHSWCLYLSEDLFSLTRALWPAFVVTSAKVPLAVDLGILDTCPRRVRFDMSTSRAG